MDYNASKIDERYARRLVMDANYEARRFVDIYREVQAKNDQGLYVQANDSRQTVATEQIRLTMEHSELPLVSQGLVLEASARLQLLLDERPAFPDPLLNNVTARETYVKRLTHGQCDIFLETVRTKIENFKIKASGDEELDDGDVSL